MPPKKKGGKKSQKGNKAKSDAKVDQDDDWEALLEVKDTPKTEQPPPKEEIEPEPEKKKEPAVLSAADAFLASQGIDVGGGEKAEGAKKKKKKKKKGGEKKEEEKVSSRGAIIAERLRKQKEEEDRILALEKEEADRIAELERKEEEERKKKEDERERKKQRQKEKIDKMKKDGTYMTKKQKEKAKKDAERLEALMASGMVVPTAGEGEEDGKKKKVVYDNRKKKGKKSQQKKPEVEPEPEPEVEVEPVVEVEEESGDDWDAKSSSGDDWDADSTSSNEIEDSLTAKLAAVTLQNEVDNEEDLIAMEKRKDQERLRKLGLEQKKRQDEEALKLAAMQQQQEELSRQEMLVAQKREAGKLKRLETEKANVAARTKDDLRCPIVVIMGHVDTGKTKLLDKIRKTNVQEGEAGGITQQIGATFFEKKTLETQTARLNVTEKFDLEIPGMLVIDTPGHESFSNLRSRGSSLCDIAILVVDLMHGLEQQTIESLTMLRKKKVPFLVALNKIDRCYDWQTCPDAPIREALSKQPEGTVSEFRTRAMEAKVQLAEQGVNSNIYWEMGEDDWLNSDFVPMVPTSAITGEGVQDVLLLLCQMAQRSIWKKIMWCANLQCSVLEVKAIDGLGMTVDVLVVNGFLKEGDKAVFCTLDGPVVVEIRGLLTPPPSRESRVKSEYIHHKEVKGALGVKIIGNGLEKVMAGTPVMVVGPDDEEEDIKAEVMSDLTDLQSKLSTDKKGVMVQASTLGALEALLQFLREDTKPPIPVSAIGIGTVHKRDVTKISIMNEKKCPEYATILAFDVDIEKEAREHAEFMNVRVFTADIIYHLFDQFTRFMEDLSERRRSEAAAVAVFPSISRILPQHVFNQKDPIIVGMEVIEGILKVGTPLCVPALGGLFIGKVISIEHNGKEQDTARKGTSVAVKIVNESNPTLTYGRQFDASHSLYSTLNRASIDALKANFKDKLEPSDWKLVVKLKKVFAII